MSGITVPTLDEITGHTVMAKLRNLCKKFIGLAQEVDDKIDAPLAEAHLAVETANATLATAQDAATTANSASETATQASESAQESAETVAGYNDRLTTVENGKVNIVDINNYAVGLTGNQEDILGTKRFSDIRANIFGYKNTVFGSNDNGYIRVYKGKNGTSTGVQIMISFMNGKGYSANDRNNWAIMIFCARTNISDGEIVTVAQGSYQTAGAYALTYDNENHPEIWVKNTIPGTTNHRMVSQVIMESDTNGIADYFEVSDYTLMDETTFVATYPNAKYSS